MQPGRKLDPLWLILAGAALLLLWDAHRPLQIVDEFWYSEVARNMLDSGDLLTPRLGGHPEWIKPPLFYWLSLPGLALSPSVSWGIRLVPALAFLGSLWLLHRLVRQAWGSTSAHLAALVFLLTSDHLHVHGARNGVFEAVLNFEFALAFWLNLRLRTRPLAALWLGPVLGLAVLTKSAFAAVPLGLTLVNLWLLGARRPRLKILLGAAGLMLLVCLPWFVAVVWIHGSAVFDEMIVDQVLARLANDAGVRGVVPGRRFGRAVPGAVLLHLATFAQPWIMVAPLALWRVFTARRAPLDARTHAQRLAVVWVLGTVGALLLSRSSWPWYSSSVDFPLALLVGELLAAFWVGRTRPSLDLVLVSGCLAACLVSGGALAFNPFQSLPTDAALDEVIFLQLEVWGVAWLCLRRLTRGGSLPGPGPLAALALAFPLGVNLLLAPLRPQLSWGLLLWPALGVAALGGVACLRWGWGARPLYVAVLLGLGLGYVLTPLQAPGRWEPIPSLRGFDQRLPRPGGPPLVVRHQDFYDYVVLLSSYHGRLEVEFRPEQGQVELRAPAR